MKLIKSNRADRAESVIQENNLLSVENFISLYNSGMLNKSSAKVSEIAAIVSEGFKNIELKNKTLSVSSSEEVELDEAINALHNWVPVLKLIREIKEETAKNSGEEFWIIIDSDNSVLKEDTLRLETGEEETVLVAFTSEAIFSKKDKVSEILATAGISAEETAEDGSLQFSSSQVLDVDTSFIEDLSRIIPVT